MKITAMVWTACLAVAIGPAATPAGAGSPTPLLLAQAATQPPATAPAKKPAAAAPAPVKAPAKPAAKPQAAPAKPAAPAAKPAAAPAKKPAPASANDAVTVTDDPANPYIRLDSRLRETVYELRYSLTTLVTRANGARQHLLAVQVTHHEETPRAYARAERDGAPALAMTASQRPSLQCTRNRDKSRACFHDESYVMELPDAYLAQGRKSGLTLRLAAAAAPPMTMQVEAAMIEAQLAATEKAATKK